MKITAFFSLLLAGPVAPAAFTTRRYELFWKYGLTLGKHTVRIKLLNPVEGGRFRMSEVLVYTGKPADAQHAANAR